MRLNLLCIWVCSHVDKTTTWHDPRLSQLQSAAAQQHPIPGPPVHAHSLSNPAATTPQQNINPETGITLTPPPSNPPLFSLWFLFKAQTCLSQFRPVRSGSGLCWGWYFCGILCIHGSGDCGGNDDTGRVKPTLLQSVLQAAVRGETGSQGRSVCKQRWKQFKVGSLWLRFTRMLKGRFTQITR